MTLSPTSWPGGGGGSYTPPTDRGLYRDPIPGGTLIANIFQEPLPWVLQEGTQLFDLTDPTFPLVLTAGIYSVWAFVQPYDDMTADGFFELTLFLDDSIHSASVTTESRLATAAWPVQSCAVGGTFYIPLGGDVRLKCRNQDGVNAIHFGIALANVQRIT